MESGSAALGVAISTTGVEELQDNAAKEATSESETLDVKQLNGEVLKVDVEPTTTVRGLLGKLAALMDVQPGFISVATATGKPLQLPYRWGNPPDERPSVDDIDSEVSLLLPKPISVFVLQRCSGCAGDGRMSMGFGGYEFCKDCDGLGSMGLRGVVQACTIGDLPPGGLILKEPCDLTLSGSSAGTGGRYNTSYKIHLATDGAASGTHQASFRDSGMSEHSLPDWDLTFSYTAQYRVHITSREAKVYMYDFSNLASEPACEGVKLADDEVSRLSAIIAYSSQTEDYGNPEKTWSSPQYSLRTAFNAERAMQLRQQQTDEIVQKCG
eukprot:TRINITY_DN26743_c0_g2_i1.p1 TRINITY_DN26743_c0_g2~~TRINITY_DN26743_c0_g2_i1.p1  ORF type:complete len:326 (-),score=43.89 TRINITY_DN26743_c0_g2_i1:15-992(-)